MLQNNQKPEDRNQENPFDNLSKPAQPEEALSQDKSPAALQEPQVARPQGGINSLITGRSCWFCSTTIPDWTYRSLST